MIFAQWEEMTHFAIGVTMVGWKCFKVSQPFIIAGDFGVIHKPHPPQSPLMPQPMPMPMQLVRTLSLWNQAPENFQHINYIPFSVGIVLTFFSQVRKTFSSIGCKFNEHNLPFPVFSKTLAGSRRDGDGRGLSHW